MALQARLCCFLLPWDSVLFSRTYGRSSSSAASRIAAYGAVTNSSNCVLSRIIVGVKYCFRYNARQRARANGEEEPVDLQAMPRPHRRRREKKLMTLDEVNERFPATKYKSWRAHRELMGLPSEGGIKTAPNSRPASVKHLEAASSSVGESTLSPTSEAAILKEVLGPSTINREPSPSTSELAKETSTPAPIPAATSSSNESKRLSDISDIDRQKDSDNDDDEEEHIHAVVPDELLNTSGDSCAICIDVIDDDDDIRGLTCGHAFHAGCLDPWLTSRRACCPLCKADYYIPKPRPEGESSSADEASRRARRQEREPVIPPDAYIGPPFHRRMLFSGRFMSSYHGSEQGRSSRNANSGSSTAAQAGSDVGAGGNRWLRNPLRGVLPSIRRSGHGPEEPTPGALEAGLSNRTNGNSVPTPATQRPTPVPTPLQGAGTH